MQTIYNLFIRPKRDTYNLSDLGPSEFTLNGSVFQRRDFQLSSVQGQLHCSWFLSKNGSSRPCIVYCHGNCGSRLDILEIRDSVLAFNYSLFCFDFGGSGLSDGQYVSLGHYEHRDIATVVDYLEKSGRASSIVLWGRSMGAVAIMMYVISHPPVPVIVLDSPFSSLTDLTNEMIRSYKIIPTALKEMLMEKVKKNVKKIAGFDINQIEPLEQLRNHMIPTVILHSPDDELVRIEHSKRIFKASQGAKFFLEVTGSHNAVRHPVVLYRVLNILEYFVDLAPEIEDVNLTIRSPLPDLSEQTKKRIRRNKL